MPVLVFSVQGEVNYQEKWIKYTLKKLSRADSEPKVQRHVNTVPCRWEGKNNFFRLDWPKVQKLWHNYGLINLMGKVGGRDVLLWRKQWVGAGNEDPRTQIIFDWFFCATVLFPVQMWRKKQGKVKSRRRCYEASGVVGLAGKTGRRSQVKRLATRHIQLLIKGSMARRSSRDVRLSREAGTVGVDAH